MDNSKISENVNTVTSRRPEDPNSVNKQKRQLEIPRKNQFAEDDIKRYHSRFPELIQSIWDYHVDFKAPMERFASNLSRLLPNKLLFEGLNVVEIYKNITNSISEQGTKNAEILGWCYDIFVCTCLIHDDIMEESKVRGGNPTYHTWEDVGTYAANDLILMEYFICLLLKKFFGTKPWFQDCVEILHDGNHKTAIGQSFEKCLSQNGKLQFHTMTLETFKRYASYKASFVVAQVPLMFSHFAADNYDIDFPEKVRNIIDEFGLYVTVLNDMVNYASVIKGTKTEICDIGRGGFTWLITQALIKGSSSQKEILKQNYGVNNPDSVRKVIAVFEDLKMFDLFEQFKKNSLEYVYAETEKASISRAHKKSILKLAELWY